jgi:hypothetical protein
MFENRSIRGIDSLVAGRDCEMLQCRRRRPLICKLQLPAGKKPRMTMVNTVRTWRRREIDRVPGFRSGRVILQVVEGWRTIRIFLVMSYVSLVRQKWWSVAETMTTVIASVLSTIRMSLGVSLGVFLVRVYDVSGSKRES